MKAAAGVGRQQKSRAWTWKTPWPATIRPTAARVVEPSNEVYLYVPRFGAVRQVVGLVANEERQRARRRQRARSGSTRPPSSNWWPTRSRTFSRATKSPPGHPWRMRTEQSKDIISTRSARGASKTPSRPYENMAIIRHGQVRNERNGRFWPAARPAAIAWSHTQSVQIVLEHQGAMAEVKYDQTESVYTVSEPPGCPKLRLVKVASTPFAQPGEDVDFTLRFDNIGNQPIGNVAILDSLNTRLEYVPGSAQCSVDAKFAPQRERGRLGRGPLRVGQHRSIRAKAAFSASAAACGRRTAASKRLAASRCAHIIG